MCVCEVCVYDVGVCDRICVNLQFAVSLSLFSFFCMLPHYRRVASDTVRFRPNRKLRSHSFPQVANTFRSGGGGGGGAEWEDGFRIYCFPLTVFKNVMENICKVTKKALVLQKCCF